MITTEEFFTKYADNISLAEGHYDYLVEKDNFKEAMIKFAKLHVIKALKAASENAELTSDKNQDFRLQHCSCVDYLINKDSVLESYPLENIK